MADDYRSNWKGIKSSKGFLQRIGDLICADNLGVVLKEPYKLSDVTDNNELVIEFVNGQKFTLTIK